MSRKEDVFREQERRFVANWISVERRAKIEKHKREGKVARYLSPEQLEAKTQSFRDTYRRP